MESSEKKIKMGNKTNKIKTGIQENILNAVEKYLKLRF